MIKMQSQRIKSLWGNKLERGALIFNREAKKTTSGWMPLYSTQNPSYYSKTSADFAPNNAIKVTDYQVTEWVAPNGVQVSLQVNPMYDKLDCRLIQ